MSSSTRATIVITVAVIAMAAIGASLAYGATLLVNKWVGVLIIGVIMFGGAPDLEMGFGAAVCTAFASAVPAHYPLLMILPGCFAGFYLIFRAGPFLEWLYPPLGRPPEEEGRAAEEKEGPAER
jgi:hypothetical protein